MERLEVSDSLVLPLRIHLYLISAPYLLILRNRGQELRFYRGEHLRLREEEFRNFLRAEDWKHTLAWSSSFAPGGDR